MPNLLSQSLQKGALVRRRVLTPMAPEGLVSFVVVKFVRWGDNGHFLVEHKDGSWEWLESINMLVKP